MKTAEIEQFFPLVGKNPLRRAALDDRDTREKCCRCAGRMSLIPTPNVTISGNGLSNID